MKPHILWTAALALCAPAVLSAQAFEGTITALMTADRVEMQVAQHVRGTMVRQDVTTPQGNISVITDRASGKSIILMHDQKMWMDMGAMAEMMGRGRGATASEPAKDLPEIRRTDRTETIAGHECRHHIMVAPQGETDLCAATGMGVFLPGMSPSQMGGMGAMGPMGGMGGMRGRGAGGAGPELPTDAALWLATFGDGFFVLKMQNSDMTWIARSVERKSLPPDLFEPPADYSEMKLPGRGM